MASNYRGDLYWANLNPQKGSEQAGLRPAVILQADIFNRTGNTVVIIPFTSNLKRAKLPCCVFVAKSDTNRLNEDSVALCHQVRVIDKSGIQARIGTLEADVLSAIEKALKLTLGL